MQITGTSLVPASGMDHSSHATTADRVAFAVETIRGRWSCSATTAVILGTGLGELADELAAATAIDYRDIPGFPRSTALAHKGRLVCGELDGAPVILLQGRCHLYEGYRISDLTLPVRVLAALGVQTLVITNAAGGLNPDFTVGDVMLIDDHVNLMGRAGGVSLPIGLPDLPATNGIGVLTHPARRGRFYDLELAQLAEQTARLENFPLRRGTYVAVTGPSYETRAEYRAFRRLGGDAVGMSTVPEVLTAAASGLRVLGLSIVTNVACPDAPKIVSAEEVVAVARIARPRVRAIVHGVLADQKLKSVGLQPLTRSFPAACPP
jgi:purine-nucleoside phosphorylase